MKTIRIHFMWTRKCLCPQKKYLLIKKFRIRVDMVEKGVYLLILQLQWFATTYRWHALLNSNLNSNFLLVTFVLCWKTKCLFNWPFFLQTNWFLDNLVHLKCHLLHLYSAIIKVINNSTSVCYRKTSNLLIAGKQSCSKVVAITKWIKSFFTNKITKWMIKFWLHCCSI